MIPKASVVIPLYNKAPCIARVINSTLAQTFNDFEVIVVDDGSTDGGADIVKEIINDSKDSRLKLVHQENKGPGSARNKGLFLAQGKYISFLDADDEWLPEFLEKGLEIFLKLDNEIAAVIFGCDKPGDAESKKNSKMWDQRGVFDGVYELSSDTSPEFGDFLLSYMNSSSNIFKRAIIEEYGGFFDQYRCLYGEDAYLWLKILLNEKIVVSREKLAILHTESSSLSGNLTGPHPTEPFLSDPSGIIAICPSEKLELLNKILAIRATDTALGYAPHDGYKAEIMNILKHHCVKYKPQGYYKAWFLGMCSPVRPVLRPYWHKIKALKQLSQ